MAFSKTLVAIFHVNCESTSTLSSNVGSYGPAFFCSVKKVSNCVLSAKYLRYIPIKKLSTIWQTTLTLYLKKINLSHCSRALYAGMKLVACVGVNQHWQTVAQSSRARCFREGCGWILNDVPTVPIKDETNLVILAFFFPGFGPLWLFSKLF